MRRIGFLSTASASANSSYLGAFRAGMLELRWVEGREYVIDARYGLMSYAASYTDNFRRAAAYVDKIFKGAKPGDLPVQQPIKFEMVVNMKTAKAMGFKFTEAFMIRVDRVIE